MGRQREKERHNLDKWKDAVAVRERMVETLRFECATKEQLCEGEKGDRNRARDKERKHTRKAG